MRRFPRCTHPLNLASEGIILDDCSIKFSWSSARPWVPRVWLAPWPGLLRIRFAGEEGQVEGRVPGWRRPFLCCRRVAGIREAWPPPGGCGRVVVRVRHHGLLRLASTPWVFVARAG